LDGRGNVAEQYRCPDVQISGGTRGVSKLHLGWYCVKGKRERNNLERDRIGFHVQDTNKKPALSTTKGTV
jgi:hypothetical protein